MLKVEMSHAARFLLRMQRRNTIIELTDCINSDEEPGAEVKLDKFKFNPVSYDEKERQLHRGVFSIRQALSTESR